MKVGFNARLLYDPNLRGWNRYTVNLLRELGALGTELFLYSEKPVHEQYLKNIGVTVTTRASGQMRYVTWEQTWLPTQAARDGIEILHSPFNYGLPWRSPCPTVLTLHDAIEQVYYLWNRPWHERLRLNALRSEIRMWLARSRADRVITVSEFSKRDLIQHLGVRAEKISVIAEAADPVFTAPMATAARARARAQYGLGQDYVWYVGGWEKRKNVGYLLRGFAAAGLKDVDLVLAGGGDSTELKALASQLGMSARVKFLGWVKDEDLPALYAGALCFCYPSEYEGFGLQLCESMASGCATLAANATSLPEILGDGGETFALGDAAELGHLLRRVATDTDYRIELRARALKRAIAFSWKRAAEETMALYKAILADSA